MKLNRTSWHYKVYAWWHMRKYDNEANRANLCSYVRTILFYAPLRYIFCWGCPVYTYAILLVAFPLTLQFTGNYDAALEVWTFYAWFLVCASIVLAACWLACKYEDYLTKHRKKPDPNTTWSLTKSYIKSIHNKVCPIINFSEPD